MGAVKEASAKTGGLEGDLLVDGAGDGHGVNVVFGHVALEDGSALEWLVVAADLEPSVSPTLGNEVELDGAGDLLGRLCDGGAVSLVAFHGAGGGGPRLELVIGQVHGQLLFKD